MVVVKTDEKVLEAALWKQVPEACREGSQSVVTLWHAHYPTAQLRLPGEGKTHSHLTQFLSLPSLPSCQTHPWAKAKLWILFALLEPLTLSSCVGLSPSGEASSTP